MPGTARLHYRWHPAPDATLSDLLPAIASDESPDPTGPAVVGVRLATYVAASTLFSPGGPDAPTCRPARST